MIRRLDDVDRKSLLASFGSGFDRGMSMEGSERVNFMREEIARAISTYGPLFEGEAKVVRRRSLVRKCKTYQGQTGRPQRPELVTI
jgi:hypothetical protein